MLILGFGFCLVQFIKKDFSKSEDRAIFLERNLQFFNTHPYMASWIMGATIRLEEQSIEEARFDTKQMDRFKKRMSESLAAIGDQLFWGKLKPIAAMLGLALALYNKVLGFCVFLFLYNLPHFYMRIKGLLRGYKIGLVLERLVSRRKFKGIFEFFSKLVLLSTVFCIN